MSTPEQSPAIVTEELPPDVRDLTHSSAAPSNVKYNWEDSSNESEKEEVQPDGAPQAPEKKSYQDATSSDGGSSKPQPSVVIEHAQCM